MREPMLTDVTSQKRASIRDVAREAGVSHTTVSLILNGKLAGSDATRERVMEAVQRLGYQPDPLFRKAISERVRNSRGEERPLTGIFAYVVPSWRNREVGGHAEGFYSSLTHGVAETAEENNYHPLLCPQEMKPSGIPAVIQDGRVDGVLIDGTFPVDWVKLLLNHMPCVYMNRYYPGVPAAFVTSNWVDAGRRQVQHAWDLGHRNFAFCEADDQVGHLVSTYDAFQSMLRHLGGKLIHPELSRFLGKSLEINLEDRLAQFVEEWAALRPRPSVILTKDSIAVRLLKELQKRGLSVPRDVSIVSRMGHEWGQQTSPRLTSYAYPNREIARTATRMLIDGIRVGRLHPSHVMLEGEMIIGESVRPATEEEKRIG